MGKVLIIGCGGVASVAIQKCCQHSDVFEEICIASRTKSKCDALKEKLESKTATKITTEQVDADKVDELVALIKKVQPAERRASPHTLIIHGSGHTKKNSRKQVLRRFSVRASTRV